MKVYSLVNFYKMAALCPVIRAAQTLPASVVDQITPNLLSNADFLSVWWGNGGVQGVHSCSKMGDRFIFTEGGNYSLGLFEKGGRKNSSKFAHLASKDHLIAGSHFILPDWCIWRKDELCFGFNVFCLSINFRIHYTKMWFPLKDGTYLNSFMGLSEQKISVLYDNHYKNVL